MGLSLGTPIERTDSPEGSASRARHARVFSRSFIEALRKSGQLEGISGVGDEAYFRNNKDLYAELVVKIGSRLLTLQADADKGMETVKSHVIELARVYVAKLR